jgi:hypothetical protein
MKKIIILFILVFSLGVFADVYNINAVYNESIAKHYIINDTNLIQFKSDLKDTHIVSVGYYSEVTGYLDFTNLEVSKSGDNNFYIVMKIIDISDTKIIVFEPRKPDLNYTKHNYYSTSQSKFKLKETENWYYEKPYKKVNVTREVIVND